jgi:peptidoglycan-associated lipoprotein
MKNAFGTMMTAMGILFFGLGGCAGISEYNLKQQVEKNRLAIEELQRSDEEQNDKLNTLMDTVQEAIARAKNAGALAQGMFMYEVTLNDNAVHFGFDSSELSKKAKAALDKFALQLKVKNEDVYIEIQGHTDDVGSEPYNVALGMARAAAVMGYLHVQHGLPLYRMSTFSYGESRPLVDNGSPDNRGKNRRVTLVVVK